MKAVKIALFVRALPLIGVVVLASRVGAGTPASRPYGACASK
jgi:hypothetical protein